MDELVSQASAEEQQEARSMGWIPPEKFKGDPEKYVDATEFIRRGKEIIPILESNNQKLKRELDALRSESTETRKALEKANEALEEINVRHSVETQKAVEKAREELKAQLAEASREGDHAGVAELTDKLTQLNVALPEEKPAKVEAKPFVPGPELVAFQQEFEWFGKDRRKTALVFGIAEELRMEGVSPGAPFLARLTEEVKKELGDKNPPRESKVDGGNGEARTTGRTNGKSYSDLPADAKAACDADAKQFVGKNRKYPDMNAWRKSYAEIYFRE